jgi:DNA-binding NarL/FixJ family response regulator
LSPYTIVLADDHALFRGGVKRIIKEHADLEIIGEAGDGLNPSLPNRPFLINICL